MRVHHRSHDGHRIDRALMDVTFWLLPQIVASFQGFEKLGPVGYDIVPVVKTNAKKSA